MANLATTRVSSKGQVVIPEDIRKRLKLKSGSRFVVVGKDDVIIQRLKRLRLRRWRSSRGWFPRLEAKQERQG
jgi:AbrB family looped-hinge helix DNA binding protein